MKAVVYTSNTGSTEHYAKLLGHELSVSVYSTEEAGNMVTTVTSIMVIALVGFIGCYLSVWESVKWVDYGGKILKCVIVIFDTCNSLDCMLLYTI